MNQKASEARSAESSAAPLSPGRRRLFALVAALLPLLALLGAEGILRLAGFGGYPPLLREVGPTRHGTLFISDIEAARSYFFANKDRPGYNEQYHYYQPKATNAFRVLMAGGSAIKGYPQPRNLAPSAFLREMLQDVWPEREVDVLNLGTTAVASFPVMEMVEEGLAYEPDLVVIYSGHNEFFGAYGVASINRAGSRPGMLRFQRWLRSTALMQGIDAILPARGGQDGKALMEIMVGQSYTPPQHWSRDAAANNLYHHMRRMILACRARGVPILICTLPSNERDLAPIGEVHLDDVPEEHRAEVSAALQRGQEQLGTDPASAEQTLRGVLEVAPLHARAHFLLGRALYAQGRFEEARTHFVQARDADSMPWRATTASQDGLRRAATDLNEPLCDVEASFRAASPGGCIGWELMDDHVHPSLQGQSLIARTIVDHLTRAEGKLKVDPAAFAALPPWDVYAKRLGDNPYDRYGVEHQMRVLFNVPFMKTSNPDALARFDTRCKTFEATLQPDLLELARQWQSHVPHAGGKRPITGMMARGLMRRGDFAGALPLLQIAQHSVPDYTSWHMEYVYFELACLEKLQGPLTEAHLARANEEIERGKLLLKRGYSESGMTERYVGRLHQLRGEFAEAIPYLLAARPKVYGFDLVGIDQALFVSYMQTGNPQKARAIAENGVQHSGTFAEHYRQLLSQLPAP